jgi:hypothetical protein
MWVIKSRRMRSLGHVATMGAGEWCTGFWWENLNERDCLGYPGMDGRIIVRWIFRIQGMRVGGMDWIKLAEDGDRWQALENVVMNLRVP